VHAKHGWVIVKWQFLHEVSVALHFADWGNDVRVGLRKFVCLLEYVFGVKHGEDSDKTASVQVVGDTASVVNVSGDVDEGLPGDLFLLLYEHLHDLG